jgi:hypothetical protein
VPSGPKEDLNPESPESVASLSFARTVSSTADAIWLIGVLFILQLVVVQLIFVVVRVFRGVEYRLLTRVPFPTFVNAWPACSLLVDPRGMRLLAHNSP